MDIVSLLKLGKSRNASDLHLVVGQPPLLRIDGSLGPIEGMERLTNDDMREAFEKFTSEKQREEFEKNCELDFGVGIADVGRVRFNVAKQRNTVSIVARLLPSTIPSPEELGLPDICKELILRPRGLVVISGPTGSGKSTTLASMIDYLNQLENKRVVTIEDPVEYTYTNLRCTITQRELGSDTLSFAEALRHVLRQDPDVILVGEMRDLETASAALTVAETGHLVLTTGHAPSASQAVERIINMFPPHERYLAQARLSSLLLGILCQSLIPKANDEGRVAAIEIMLANAAVRNLVREGKSFQLPNTIRVNTHAGMQLMDQALVNLYHDGVITMESVHEFCNDREEIARLTGGKEAWHQEEPTPVTTTYYSPEEGDEYSPPPTQ
jgi:twitching motility protein PilT